MKYFTSRSGYDLRRLVSDSCSLVEKITTTTLADKTGRASFPSSTKWRQSHTRRRYPFPRKISKAMKKRENRDLFPRVFQRGDALCWHYLPTDVTPVTTFRGGRDGSKGSKERTPACHRTFGSPAGGTPRSATRQAGILQHQTGCCCCWLSSCHGGFFVRVLLLKWAQKWARIGFFSLLKTGGKMSFSPWKMCSFLWIQETRSRCKHGKLHQSKRKILRLHQNENNNCFLEGDAWFFPPKLSRLC